MMLFNKKQKKGDFTITDRIKLFEVEDETQILEICEWQGKGYQSPYIKEVKEW